MFTCTYLVGLFQHIGDFFPAHLHGFEKQEIGTGEIREQIEINHDGRLQEMQLRTPPRWERVSRYRGR